MSSMDDRTARMNPPGRPRRKTPRKKPMKDPARPSRIVIPMPRGSGPGRSTRATAPTIRPTSSRLRMLRITVSVRRRGEAEELLEQPDEGVEARPGGGAGRRLRRGVHARGLLAGKGLDGLSEVG